MLGAGWALCPERGQAQGVRAGQELVELTRLCPGWGRRGEVWPPGPPAQALALPHRAVIYLKIQVVKGQRRIIGLLKEQITNVSAQGEKGGRYVAPAGVPRGLGAPR